MNQRKMEKEIWQAIGAEQDGKTFEEMASDAGIEPKSVAEAARFIRAREYVMHQIWRHAG